jgi:nitrogen fixation protein FixH
VRKSNVLLLTAALISASFLIGLAACGKMTIYSAKSDDTSSQNAKPAAPAWPGKVVLTTDPPAPVSGQDTAFRVTLTDAAGKPVSGAKVEADLKMQTMDMGKNVVSLADKGDGTYEGKGQFTMAGPWNIIIVVTKAGTTGQQQFQIVAQKSAI